MSIFFIRFRICDYYYTLSIAKFVTNFYHQEIALAERKE